VPSIDNAAGRQSDRSSWKVAPRSTWLRDSIIAFETLDVDALDEALAT